MGCMGGGGGRGEYSCMRVLSDEVPLHEIDCFGNHVAIMFKRRCRIVQYTV